METVMTDQSPAQVVNAFMNAMEKMDFDLGVTYVADDLEYINSPGTAVRGPGGVRAVLEPFFAPIEENEFVILRQVSDGNMVVLERLDRHHIPQGWFELPVTGVFEVNDGKITYWREYFDVETIRSAMEALTGAAG
jgi:limonene-1,2-epoxide hydrolase